MEQVELEVVGGVAMNVLTTVGSTARVDIPEFSEIRIPGPLVSALVERKALKSTPLPADKLPPVTVQFASGIDPTGKALTPDTYKQPVQVNVAVLPAVKLPKLSM